MHKFSQIRRQKKSYSMQHKKQQQKGEFLMKVKHKILLGSLATLVVIGIVLTSIFVIWPNFRNSAQSSSQETSLENIDSTVSKQDDVKDGNSSLSSKKQTTTTSSSKKQTTTTSSSKKQAGNSSEKKDNTSSEATGKNTALNNPVGWNSGSDKSKNASGFSWPNISPNDLEAGSPITQKGNSSGSGPIAQFVFMQKLNPGMPFSVECNISGNRITAVLPAGTYINNLKPEFVINGDKVLFEGTEITSGNCAFNFTVPVELTVVSGNKKTKYTVYVITLNTGLPSMSITTEGNTDIVSKTEYKKCNVFAGGGDTSNGDYSFQKNQYISGAASIKGRGWTSWYYYDKKSYTLKFEKKQEFLGLPAHTEWVLSANFADRSLIRNAVAMQLAHNLGSEAVMDVRFIDLWVNGVYVGNYQLIEKIEVSKNRVNITKFDEKLSPDKIGYIIETNGHNKAEGEFGKWTNGQDADRPSKWQKLNENITLDPISGDMFFNSTLYNGIIFNVNKPSDTKLMALSEAKRLSYLEYIYDYMYKTEKAIKSRKYSEASKYLDMEAMAKWYIVEELAMNTDSRLHCSCYMYKDAGGKLKMGPVWDFDLGFGNGKYTNENHVDKTYLDSSRWFADLLAMPEFKAVVKSVWGKSKFSVLALPNFVDKTAKLIDKSQAINFERWSITQYAEHTYYRSTEELYTFEEQVDYLRYFVEDRIDYMNQKIMGW